MKKLTAATMVCLALASAAGALDLVATLEDVRPRGIGVDGQGHLWLLHASGTRVTQVSPGGERRSWSIPKSWYVDVDSRWGAAALDPYGKEVRVVSTEGDILATIPMEHEAGDVAWIDESRVAVTPTRAAHRVEIWNVKAGSLVKTFGEEEAIVHRIGAYFVRRVFVEYHEASKRLHTLETRTGDYRAFDLDGYRLAARELENPRRAEFDAWIERVDRERTQMGEDLGMPMNWFRLATDPKGDAITVRGCNERGTRALLVQVPMEGPPGESEVEVACCSQEFTIWQSGIVFAEASSASGDGCYLKSTGVTGFPAVWLEVTPQSRDAEPSVHTAAEAPIEAADLVPGLSMVCWGGQEAAVSCERQVFEEGAVVHRSPLPGLAVAGTIFVGRFPTEAARISVVPHGLAFRRQFTVPLAWDSETRELRRQVSTDAKGRFRVPPLAPGDWFLEVHLPGGRLERSEPFTLPERSAREETKTPPKPFDLGVLSFDVGTRLEVYVTDSKGLPVPDAQVGGAQGAQPLESDFFEVRADESGLAVVTGLEPDEQLSIACTAEGYTWVRQTYETPPADASCTLEALATLRGTVVDVDEEPVAEATLSLSALQKEASTADDGSFALRELKPGTYALSVAAPGLSSRSVDLELTPGDDLDLGALELAPGRSLRVRVLDAETGEPVPGARVEILEPRGGGGGVSDPDGEVRLKTGSTETLLLETQAGGYAAARDEVSPEMLDGSEAVPLELSRAGYLEVQAWHPDGSPCSGCTVWVMSRETETVSLQVDATGHVRSGELPPGDYQAILARERSLGRVVQVSGGDNVRRAAIEPRRTTTVRFGEATAALHVVLDPPLSPGWRLQAQGPGWDRLYEAGADVELPREPGESVRLAAGGPGGTTIELGTIPASYDRDAYHLEVPNGSAGGVLVRDELSAERRPLTLTLRDATTGHLRATMRSISTGAFHIPFLYPGVYILHAGDTPLTTFSVSPGRREDLGELTLQ